MKVWSKQTRVSLCVNSSHVRFNAKTVNVLLRICQYSSSAKETQPQDIWDQGRAVAKHWQMSISQPITEIYTRKQSKGSSENQSKTKKVEKQQK